MKIKNFVIIFFLVSLIFIAGCKPSCDESCKEKGYPEGRCRAGILNQLDEDLGNNFCENEDTCVCAPKCGDYCQVYRSTPGECGDVIGEQVGSRYCSGNIQCVCTPQPCDDDADCQKFGIHFICSNQGCIYPGCSLACRESGYKTGICGGDEGKNIGTAYCAQTFKSCMCID